jgi:hypothetical protein
MFNLHGYRGTMAQNHIHAIIKHFQNWPIEAILSCAYRLPTLRNDNENDLQVKPCIVWLLSKGLLAYAI